MSQPERIEPPSLAAFHFISRVFNDPFGYGHANIAHLRGNTFYDFEDFQFSHDHFYAAKDVKPDQMAPLASMSDETTSHLLSILGVIIRDTLILTKADLVNAAILEMDEPDDEYSIEDCSLEQLQSFLLYHSRGDMTPHWIELAEFYNGLPPNQQNAISQFFTHCLNRPLNVLLSVPGPEQVLPAVITQELETHTQDGKHYAFCEIDQHWFRDADLSEKFMVTGLCGDLRLLMATASTLKEAVARASLYVKNIDSADPIRKVEIKYMNKVLAIAEVDSKNFWSKPFPHIELPAKLNWSREQRDIKIMADREFMKTIFETEKLLGLQWSKAHMLEDALGL